jgi:phospholipase D-like protein
MKTRITLRSLITTFLSILFFWSSCNFVIATPVTSLAGTSWSGSDSTGEFTQYRFQPDGTLAYKSTKGSFTNATWKQKGATVTFEVNNHYAEYRGEIRGSVIEGTATNKQRFSWTWKVSRDAPTNTTAPRSDRNIMTPSPQQATPFDTQSARRDEEATKACAVCGTGCGGSIALLVTVIISLCVLNIAFLVWVARDAKSRGMDNSVLWMILVMFTSLIGLIIYLLARPQGELVQCPNCHLKRLKVGAICPHCQHP